jgi:heme exporter protein A
VGLVRAFGSLRAVDGVSFALPAGETLTLLGPNGAGKSTLLRILSGELRPASGDVRFGGETMDLRSATWRRRVGVLSHQTFLYGHLTARENLRFYADLFELDGVEERVRAGLDGVGLESRADDQVRTYSRGMRQRLALARTLLHEPEMVLLDEPYTGLDAHAAGVLREVLATLRDGRRTVILVTHNLTEGLELADRVAIQVRGRLVVDAPAADFDPLAFHGVYRDAVERAVVGQ